MSKKKSEWRAYRVEVTTAFKREWLPTPFAGMKSDGGSKHVCVVIAQDQMEARAKAQAHCHNLVSALAAGCKVSDIVVRCDRPKLLATGDVVSVHHSHVF